MPHFTLTLSPQGPLVDAVVAVSGARRQALEKAGQTIPDPIPIRALLDTGASGTCIDPAVLTALGLTPTGMIAVNTPTTGNQPHQAFQYDVGLLIPAPAGLPLVRPSLAVVASELLQRQGFHALIGRDILHGCILTYNGSAGLFMLAY